MTTNRSPTEHHRRWNEEVWETGNLDVVDELIAERFVGRDPALPEAMRGPGGAREVVQMIHAAFSDVTVETEAAVGDGERFAVYDTFRAEHTGEYMGIEPTGETFEVGVVAFQRFENGKLVEERQLVDRYTMLRQIGVLEEPVG